MTDLPDGPPDTAEPPPDPATSDEGGALVNASFAAVGVLVVTGAAGVADPDGLGVVTAVASVVLFALGVVGFLYGYGVGVTRSRDEQITIGGLFFLSGTAPPQVRFRLRLALALQVVVAVAVAIARPYTAVAFISLAPLFGLGVMAAWAARYGTFFPKDDDRPGRRRDDDGS